MSEETIKKYYSVHSEAWKLFLGLLRSYENTETWAQGAMRQADDFILRQDATAERYAKHLAQSIIAELVNAERKQK